MRIILMQDVLHTGKRGEVVNVKPGYARNCLIPQGLALEASDGNVRVFEQQRHRIDARHMRERDAAQEVAEALEKVDLRIAKRVGEGETLYGSVTATEVAEMLKERGFQVDRRRIDLEGGIKTLGEHEVRIELHSDVTAALKLSVIPEEA